MNTLANGKVRHFKENIHERSGSPQENRSNPSGYFNGSPKEDRWICRSIVFILGLVILIIITGLFIFSIKGSNIKIELITICTAISSGAIGTLAGLLAPSPNR
ncbi:hypothetical protein [Chryseobacterium sp. Mn2064]|uniref:hypothetical protein n=1 Tax=Chryseobacterium sp. Mn2064 TaxID=3395263 RepID=UPI003BD04345